MVMSDFTQETEIPKPFVKIGSDNFIAYLEGVTETAEGVVRADLNDFEKVIDVPEEITHTIGEMYEQRMRAETGVGEVAGAYRASYVTQIDAMLPGIKDDLSDESVKEVEIEQARLMYMDTQSKLRATSPLYGFGQEVDIGKTFKEALDNNGLPILPIHTHPKDANFSIQDYKQILIGNPQKEVRYFNSMMILCPDIQVLAVATKDTPIMEPDKADELIGTRMGELNQKDVNLMGGLIDNLQKMAERKRVVDTLGALKAKVGDQFPDIINDAYQQHNVQEGESDQIAEAMEQTSKQVANERSRGTNAELFAFSKEMNVKLYFSTDMKTFKEFSA